MFKKRRVMVLAFCLVFAIILVGMNQIVQAEASENPKVIKIGATYPLSGPLAAFGRELRYGVELAEEIINNKHPELNIPIAQWEGIPNLGGAKIKVILLDDRAEPPRGADLTKKLIKDDKVVGMIGCYCSGVTKAASAVAERYHIPFLNAASTSPALTERNFEWFWRSGPHDESNSKVLFEFLEGLTEGKVRGVGRIPKEDIEDVVIVSENTEFGAGASKCIEEDAPRYGYHVRKALLYPHSSPDLTTEVQSILVEKPDCIFHNPYVDDAILFMKAYKSMKATPKIIWSNACATNPDFPKALKEDAVGVLTITEYSPKLGEKKLISKQINDLFKERTGENLTGPSARVFTALQVWARVLNQAGSTVSKEIQKAFNEIEIPEEESIMPWGVKFEKSGKHKGQNIYAVRMVVQYQMSKGAEIPELEIVYPFELATADMIYPFPGWK